MINPSRTAVRPNLQKGPGSPPRIFGHRGARDILPALEQAA